MIPDNIDEWFNCVGPGWQPLLAKLVTDLDAAGWDGDIHQVKEKFGTLRFYIGAGSDEVRALIAAAEAASAKLCEDCGKPGKLRSHGWWRTLCNACNP